MDERNRDRSGESNRHRLACAADLREAAATLFPDATAIAAVGGSERLVRVEAPSGTWGVRRWADGTPAGRPRFVHAVLAHAREAGLAFVPAVAEPWAPGGGLLTLRGHQYDAQRWQPGRALGRFPVGETPAGDQINLPAAVPPMALTSLIEAVARFHEATATMRYPEPPPTLPLTHVGGAVRRSWEANRERLRPVAPSTPAVQRWIRVGERALPAALAALEAAPELAAETAIVGHFGLVPAHALFAYADGEERLVGLVDVTTAAAGSPLLDLAQLVTRFGGWTPDAAEVALASYGAVRPLSPEARRLLPTVAALDLIAEAGRLLAAAYADRRAGDPPATSAVRAAADGVVASLAAVGEVVVLGDAPTPKRTRRWVHRPRDSADASDRARDPRPRRPDADRRSPARRVKPGPRRGDGGSTT